MAYASANSRPDFSVDTSWFASLIERAKRRHVRAHAYRETYAELSAMTDRELADINLSREAIDDVAREAAIRAH